METNDTKLTIKLSEYIKDDLDREYCTLLDAFFGNHDSTCAMFFHGSDYYKVLIEKKYQAKIAMLHAASHAMYTYSPREEQEEVFNVVWKESALYQLGKKYDIIEARCD